MGIRRLLGLIVLSAGVFLLIYPLIADLPGKQVAIAVDTAKAKYKDFNPKDRSFAEVIDKGKGKYAAVVKVPKTNGWTRLRPRFSVKEPDPSKKSGYRVTSYSYIDYLTNLGIKNSRTMPSELEIADLVRKKGFAAGKAALGRTKNGSKIAGALNCFYIAPNPLPIASLAASIFFVLGAFMLAVAQALGHQRPR